MPRNDRVSKRRRAAPLSVLAPVLDDESAPTHARVAAARSIINDGRQVEDEATAGVEDRPKVEIVLPPKDRLPGQREDESADEWMARGRARSEGRRAAYCASLGEPYDPAKPIPFWPWPGDDASPELRAEAKRMADEAEAAEVERQQRRRAMLPAPLVEVEP